MRTLLLINAILLSTLLTATACQQKPRQHAADVVVTGQDTASNVASIHTDSDSLRLPRVTDPELKAELQKDLKRIVAEHAAADRSDEIQSMIVDLRALFRVLSITARALDKNSDFTSEINSSLQRYRQAETRVKDDGGRIMNALTGVYDMYAILAKMRFIGRADQQQQIQGIHNAAVAMFKPDIQAVSAAAVIAKSIYMLSTMVMRDIDSEGLYLEAFEQIEERYRQGNQVSTMDEDRYINGVFRTFEVSQLWALWMNPKKRPEISAMSAQISGKSARAENVGEQMSVATEYLYRISLHIAAETVSVIL
jgi:hypothetical protein